MLVHICCSVDSHFFLQRLREDFPEERLVGFFYDPNIHPYGEYRLRLLDVERSCRKLGIELIEGPYDFERWLEAVRGYEKVPEKGVRCEICFDRRFETSAKKAKELGEKRMTTTLLMSPRKSQEQLKRTAERFRREYGVEFVSVDYRSGGGTQRQQEEAKKARLYRQNYCGCMFGLRMQREEQGRLACELFSPVGGETLPGSIEERLEMYEKRLDLEERGISYEIVREKFLNYRLKFGWVRQKKRTVPSYILPYSTMKRRYTKGKVEREVAGVYLFNREEIRFLTLERYNRLAGRAYGSIGALISDPPSMEETFGVRRSIGLGPWDLSPVLVVEEIPEGKLEIFIESEHFPDVREKLVLL
ncbi:epoxyqueuosine reductase QueH [Hydrogenimonas sp.]